MRYLILLLLLAGCVQVPAEIAGNTSNETVEPNIIIKEEIIINITDAGFRPMALRINAGEKVIFRNLKTGKYSDAYVIGVRECREMRSYLLKPNDTYVYNFTKPLTCNYVDGIAVREEGRVYVR